MTPLEIFIPIPRSNKQMQDYIPAPFIFGYAFKENPLYSVFMVACMCVHKYIHITLYVILMKTISTAQCAPVHFCQEIVIQSVKF